MALVPNNPSFALLMMAQTVSLTPEFIIAAAGAISGLSALISSWAVSRRTARKDEVQSLREEVARLQGRVEQLSISDNHWRVKYDKLYSYTLGLRIQMVDAGLPVPAMPPIVPETTEPKTRPIVDRIKRISRPKKPDHK